MATSQEQGLRDGLKRLVLTGEQFYSKPCKVTSVDKTNLTCECESADGLSVFSEVKLNSVYGFESGFNVIPKKDSLVLVTFISKDLAYVSMFSEVEFILITIDKTILEIDKEVIDIKTGTDTNLKIESDGFTIKCGGQNLGSLLDSFFSDLISAQVLTPAGPGTFKPDTIASFTQTKTKLKQILK